jgi:hypothetical protein
MHQQRNISGNSISAALNAGWCCRDFEMRLTEPLEQSSQNGAQAQSDIGVPHAAR